MLIRFNCFEQISKLIDPDDQIIKIKMLTIVDPMLKMWGWIFFKIISTIGKPVSTL